MSFICACLDWVTFFSSGIHGYLCLRTSLELPRRRGACGPPGERRKQGGSGQPPEVLLSLTRCDPQSAGLCCGCSRVRLGSVAGRLLAWLPLDSRAGEVTHTLTVRGRPVQSCCALRPAELEPFEPAAAEGRLLCCSRQALGVLGRWVCCLKFCVTC